MQNIDLLLVGEAVENYREVKAKIQKRPTFLEIAGFPSRENVFSNVLAFFLDTRQPHQLPHAFLKYLLLSLIKSDEAKCQTTFVRREATTKNYKRLDLVVVTNTYVIGIENKVYHTLNNDLEEYADYLDETYPNKIPIKIVLSIYPTSNLAGGFTSVTYSELIKQLEPLIQMLDDQVFYHLLLKDFIKNIQNHLTPWNMTEVQIRFLADYEEEINEIISLRKAQEGYLLGRRNAIYNEIDVENNWGKGTHEHWFLSLTKNFASGRVTISCSLEISSIYIQIEFSESDLKVKFIDEVVAPLSFSTPEALQKDLIKEYIPVTAVTDKAVAEELKKLASSIDQFLMKN